MINNFNYVSLAKYAAIGMVLLFNGVLLILACLGRGSRYKDRHPAKRRDSDTEKV